MKEVWKDIQDYKGLYIISNFGRIKSIKTKEKFVTVYNEVYNFVYLFKNSKRKIFKIHQLVAIEFLNHTPCNMKLVVHHKNGIKTDNQVNNLKIVTQKENSHRHYGKDVGITLRGKKWYVRLQINGKSKYLGAFDSKKLAKKAKNKALKLEKEEKYNEIKVAIPKTLSKYKGVTFDKSRNKWKASVQREGVKYNLGRFNSEEEAYYSINTLLTNIKEP